MRTLPKTAATNTCAALTGLIAQKKLHLSLAILHCPDQAVLQRAILELGTVEARLREVLSTQPRVEVQGLGTFKHSVLWAGMKGGGALQVSCAPHLADADRLHVSVCQPSGLNQGGAAALRQEGAVSCGRRRPWCCRRRWSGRALCMGSGRSSRRT
eukprot:3492812-Rhodomonas_salina.2